MNHYLREHIKDLRVDCERINNMRLLKNLWILPLIINLALDILYLVEIIPSRSLVFLPFLEDESLEMSNDDLSSNITYYKFPWIPLTIFLSVAALSFYLWFNSGGSMIDVGTQTDLIESLSHSSSTSSLSSDITIRPTIYSSNPNTKLVDIAQNLKLTLFIEL